MAAQTVLVWRIDTSYDTPVGTHWDTNLGPVNITAGNHIHVIVDDVTFAMTAEYRSSSTPGGGSYLGTLLEGPNLFFGYNGAATLLTSSPYWQTCDGTVLRRVGTSALFPYGTLSYNEGALECVIAPVCDLEISSIYSTTDATGPINADGTLTVSATGSNGTIKFAINNPTFDYTTQGQTSGTFTGLLPGTYTIYAKDPIGCTDNIIIEVGITTVYNVKYRLEFQDFPKMSRKTHRFDILERAYVGAVNEICSDGEPLHIIQNGDANDPDKVIIPSIAEMRIWKEIAGQYADLFTDDDRKFKGEYYIDDVIYWTGYAIPEFLTEPWIHEPFELNITFTDQMGEFKNQDFKDENENKYKGDLKAIVIIAEILKKTGLELPIRCGINMFDVNMAENGEDVQLLQNSSFDDNTDWDQTGSGPAWSVGGGSADIAIETANSQILFQSFTGTIAGDYTYTHRRVSSNFNIGTDSLSISVTFYDEDDNLIGGVSYGEFVSGNNDIVATHNFTTVVPVRKVQISIGWGTGADMDLSFQYSELTGPISSADPLDQVYVDTRIFLTTKNEPLKCDYVIQKILEPFRARIYQSKGVWWITRNSDGVGTFAYREFDYNGEFVSDSSFDPKQDLKFPSEVNRALWTGRPQLSHFRNFGYFAVNHDLAKDGNLIDEGRFEEDDIIDLGSGNQIFKNFNVFQAQAGATYGFENVINGASLGAFFLDLENANVTQADNKLYSIEIPYDVNGFIKVKFQYFIAPRYAGIPYIRLGWSVKVSNVSNDSWVIADFPPDFSRDNNTDELINEVYATSFNTWNTVEVTANMGAVAAPATLQITFYMHNHYGRDFADITALKTFSISDLDDPLQVGKKVMVGEDSKLYVYESVADAVTAESLPDVVRPNDYANDFLWNLDKIVNLAPNTGLVNKFLIDNVSVSFYPRYTNNGLVSEPIDPPENLLYEEEISTFVKSNLIKNVHLGDMPRFNDEFTLNEKLIYRGYFRLADGTPTSLWARDGVLEEKPILEILLNDMRDQFSVPKRRLSGTFLSDIVWHFVNSVREDFEGSRYMFLNMDFNAKRGEYTVDMLEVVTGEDGEPPLAAGAFEADAFSTGFLIGS